MRHNHRIIPGHMGGEYTEGNTITVEVTACDKQTANHVMWHYANWRLWGKKEDEIAWKALAGFLSQEEIIRESLVAGGTYSGKLPHWTNGTEEVRSQECPGPGWVRGRSNSMREKITNYRTGKKDSERARKNKSKAAKGKAKSESHRQSLGRVLQRAEVKAKRDEGIQRANKQKWKCTITGKISTAGPLTLYQRSLGIDPLNRVKYNQSSQSGDA